ncbi:hypothetical protein Glove_303g159 [Diversispora epigaea]|uniref:Uncharacterized protein n=1 Tax=Diversispora epigaea TaxID=1348612 RepID=A0A397I2L2_9GLOM|nr:hypothetical protein Glove_303g159 [Diversispora epigaea]
MSLKFLKEKLCEIFTFPEGTEEEHISISRAVGDKKKPKCRKSKSDDTSLSSQNETTNDEASERKNFYFSSDKDLLSIIWNTGGFRMNLEIILKNHFHRIIFKGRKNSLV